MRTGKRKRIQKNFFQNKSFKNLIKCSLINQTKIFCKIRHYVRKQTLVNLYYSLAYSHLKYGILAWGNANNTLMRKLQVMQNRIIRIFNFKCLKDHVKMNNLYKSLNILQIKDIFKLEMSKYMYSFYYRILPENFNYFLSFVSSSHNHDTKSVTKNIFSIPRLNTRYGQTAGSHTGAKIWKNISPNLKLLPKYSFSKQIKKQIISKY